MSDDKLVSERSATFGEVFASREYRAVFASSMLSWIGDYLAKAAVTALVYHTTHSVGISAATFAISYVPWVLGGPVLAALAERYSYRTVMVFCDLVRAALIGLVAIPHMPVPAMLGLLFLTALANPPFDAARSALLPRILDGDRYVVATAIQNVTGQAAQLLGYVGGAGLAVYHPRGAILADAATFALSAFLIGLSVHAHTPGLDRDQRTHILRETGEGFGVVFGTDVLRAIAILIFTLMLFTAVPEGLAAGWASRLGNSPGSRGVDQALIMIGYPIGFIVGGLIVGRLLRPSLRQRLIRPFAVLAPLALVPALDDPSAPVIMLLGIVCGFAVAGLFPAANGLFVQALPNAFRARAFGVMQSGVQIMQGGAVFITGALADRYNLATVVGLWSLGGVVLMTVAATQWPSTTRFSRAIEAVHEANAPTSPGAPGPVAPRVRTAAVKSHRA